MNFKKLYYYLFYKIYKFSEAAPSKWLSDLKAGVTIIFLEILVLTSFYVYYTIYFNRYATLEFISYKTFGPLGVILILNYFAFIYKNNWKTYVEEFDKWPPKKNTIGGVIVTCVILIIIVNLIFSFYLMSLIDWKQYR
jgi:hypothetical protein